jgi:LmbE family N-acetylglucosaminyl deacetylase
MLPLGLTAPDGRALSVLAIGAHPDDIEIGAGGTLLSLAASVPALRLHYVVLTGTEQRHAEARAAANALLADAGQTGQTELTVRLHDLPEGRFPGCWSMVKDVLEQVARECQPDLVLAPSAHDAHQDHRVIAEIVPTTFRDHLYLGYEIPKWDGDLSTPSAYFPLSADIAHRKVELLHKSFPSQRGRDWWDDEVFLGLARLRGMECRAPYAEAFRCTKSVLTVGLPSSSRSSQA